MTNQPRSSKMLAAVLPPGAATVRMTTRIARLIASFSVRRRRRRGIVAASAYSSARARNPGGGAGSAMRVSSRPLRLRALT